MGSFQLNISQWKVFHCNLFMAEIALNTLWCKLSFYLMHPELEGASWRLQPLPPPHNILCSVAGAGGVGATGEEELPYCSS